MDPETRHGTAAPAIEVGRDPQSSPDYLRSRTEQARNNAALRVFALLLVVAALVAWALYGDATTPH